MTDTDKTAAEKTAAEQADAFELGMHALLKEAGCTDQAEAEDFFKIASALSQVQSKEAALQTITKMLGKGKDVVQKHPAIAAGAAGAAAGGAAGVAAGKPKSKGKGLFSKVC